MTIKQVVLATDMADRAVARAEAAESLCQQLQEQVQLQAQQQQRLTSKESTTKEQLKHLRSDGDARVIAEREASLRRRQPLCARVGVAIVRVCVWRRRRDACARCRRGSAWKALSPKLKKAGG